MTLSPSFTKLRGGIAFSLGLILVIVAGAELLVPSALHVDGNSNASFDVTLNLDNDVLSFGDHSGEINLVADDLNLNVGVDFKKSKLDVSIYPELSGGDVEISVTAPTRLDTAEVSILKPNGQTDIVQASGEEYNWIANYQGESTGDYSVSVRGVGDVTLFGASEFSVDKEPINIDISVSEESVALLADKDISPSVGLPEWLTNYDTVYPDTIIDSEGNIHVVYWSDASNGLPNTIFHHVWNPITESWSEPYTVSNNINSAHTPTLYMDSQDNVHIIYDECPKINGVRVRQLHHRSYIPDQNSFSDVHVIEDAPWDWHEFYLVVGSDDTVYIVYKDYNSAFDIKPMWLVKTDAPGNLLSKQEITHVDTQFIQSLLIDKNDNLVFVTKGPGGEVYEPLLFKRFYTDTDQWGPTAELTPLSKRSRAYLDESEVLHVGFIQYNSPYYGQFDASTDSPSHIMTQELVMRPDYTPQYYWQQILADEHNVHLVLTGYETNGWAAVYHGLNKNTGEWSRQLVRKSAGIEISGAVFDSMQNIHLALWDYPMGQNEGGWNTDSNIVKIKYRNSPSVKLSNVEGSEEVFLDMQSLSGSSWVGDVPPVSGRNDLVIYASDAVGNDLLVTKRYDVNTPVSFSEPVKLSRADDVSNPAVVGIPNRQEIALAWEEVDNNDYNVKFSRLNANSEALVFDIDIAVNMYNAKFPDVGADLNNVYVVWQDDRDGNKEIYYTIIDSDNSVVADQVRLTYNLFDSEMPVIDSSYVLWRDNRQGDFMLYFAAINGGVTQPVVVPGSGGVDDYDILVNNNKVYVAWSSAGELYYSELNTEGVVVVPKTHFASGMFPRMNEVSDENEVVVFFVGSGIEYFNINSSAQNTLIGGVSPSSLDAGVGYLGVKHLLWGAEGNTYFANFKRNDTFLTQTTMLASGSDSPVLGLGSVYSVWEQDNSTYYATSEVVESQPPHISYVGVSDVGPDYAIVEWDTNELSNSKIVYWDSDDMNSTIEVVNNSFTTHHTVLLQGLDHSTDYGFEVVSEDLVGNTGVDDDYGGFYDISTPLLREMPAMPTTLYGKVVNEGGYPVSGVEVVAYWNDTNGFSHDTSTVSIAENEIPVGGSPDLVGYYFFNKGDVKAKSGSMIVVDSPVNTNPNLIAVMASPGGDAVRVAQDISIDNDPPVVSIVSPVETTYESEELALVFNVNEPISWAGYSLNDQDEITVTELTNQSIDIVGVEGVNTLTVTATDLGDLSSETSVVFTVQDTTAPQVNFNLSGYVDGVVQLRAFVEDATSPLAQSCEVCVAEDLVCDTEWSSVGVNNLFSIGDVAGTCAYDWVSTGYGDGDYALGFRVRDSSGNLGLSLPVVVDVDNNAPAPITGLRAEVLDGHLIVVINWTQNQDTDFSEYWVMRSESDFSTVDVNKRIETEYMQEDSSYMDGVEASTTYYYGVTAVDLSGKYSPVIDTVEVMVPDYEAPIVTITSPSYDGTYPINEVVVSYYANEYVDSCVYSLNNEPFVEVSSGQSVTAIEGENSLVIGCYDAYDNFGESNTVVFYTDTILPRPIQNVSVQALDAAGVKYVSIEWSLPQEDSGELIRSKLYKSSSPFADTVGMQPVHSGFVTHYLDFNVVEGQEYYYALAGEDVFSRENTSVESRSVVIEDTTPPVVTITSPLAITYDTLDQTLVFSVNEEVHSCSATINGVGPVVLESGYDFTAIEGFNNVTVWCDDLEYNVGFDNVNFVVELPPPPPPQTCTDSDGGWNYGVKGTAVGFTGSGQPYNGTDTCSDSDFITEYACDESNVVSRYRLCSEQLFNTECVDGACVEIAPNETHSVCFENMCVEVQGAGSDVCEFDSDCITEYCGDGLCNNNESCSSCPDDCGSCAQCSDSDGGLDYYTKGTLTYQYGQMTDHCGDSNTVWCGGSENQDFCQNCYQRNGLVKPAQIACWCDSSSSYINAWSGSCSGSSNPSIEWCGSSTDQQFCRDCYNNGGRVKPGEDECWCDAVQQHVSSSYSCPNYFLTEYYCTNTTHAIQDYVCANGCSDGVCVEDGGNESYCGDGSCDANESCESCPGDCGACEVCGDGECTQSESCLNCEADCGECITCTDTDSGIALFGFTYSIGAGNWDMWLVKTDSEGNQNWEAAHGTAGDNKAYDGVATSDGGYILAGTSVRPAWLVKTDGDGKQVWNLTLSGGPTGATGGLDDMYSVVETADGGYFTAGFTADAALYDPDVEVDVWAVKTNSYGNVVWNKSYGGAYDGSAGSGRDYAYSVIQTADNGFAMAGQTTSSSAGFEDIYLIKTDSAGNLQWEKKYGGDLWDKGYDIIQTSDSGFLIAGTTRSWGAGNYDCWLVKTDSQGNLQWDTTFGDVKEDYCRAVVQADDGGYVATGYYNLGYDNWRYLLLKVDSSGNQVWNKSFAVLVNSSNRAFAIQKSPDAGYLVGGAVSLANVAGSGGQYDENGHIAKFDSIGNLVWSKTYGATGSASDNDYGWAIAASSGIDTNKRGTVTIGDDVYQDYCVDSTSVKEYYCQDNELNSVTQVCEDGCESGRCASLYCGDGICDDSESCQSCEQDCGLCYECGNGVCESAEGENAANCAQDCDTSPPAPINGTSVSQISESEVELTWAVSNDPDFAEYKIYRGSEAFNEVTGLEPREIVSVKSQSVYVDSDVVVGESYYYAVTAADAIGNEDTSVDSVGVTLDDIVAPVVTIVSPVNEVYTTQDILIEYSVNEETKWCFYSIDGGSGLSIDESLEIAVEDGDHFIEVNCSDIADNIGRDSVEFVVSTQPPSAVEGLVVESVAGENVLQLSWTSSDGAYVSYYNVYKSNESFNDVNGMSALASPTQTNYQDLGLVSEEEAYYAVTAVDGFGRELKAVVSVKGVVADTVAPEPVSGLVVEQVAGESSLSLSWEQSPESDVLNYSIYRSDESFTDVSEMTPFDESIDLGLTYTDTDLNDRADYYYAVTAVDNAGNENKSVVSVKGTVADLTPPMVIVSSVGELVVGTVMLSASVVDELGGLAHSCEVCVSEGDSCEGWTTQFFMARL